MKTARCRKEGVAHIWVAITLPVFIGFLGLAIDVGYMVWAGQALQTGVDAAVLAGAQKLPYFPLQAHNAALSIAAANIVVDSNIALTPNWNNEPGGDVTIGYFFRDTKTFEPWEGSLVAKCHSDDSLRNAIRVTARKTLPLLFGPLLGVNTVTLRRTAIAASTRQPGAVILALNPHIDRALSVSGSMNLTIHGGSTIYVNSDSATAALFSGSALRVTAPYINSVGGVEIVGSPRLPTIMSPVNPMADPLADLAQPTTSGMTNRGAVTLANGTRSLQPGYYPGGITASGTAVLALSPGIYAIGGTGLSIQDRAAMTADGVMFHITGTGSVRISGSGSIRITPPDPARHNFPNVGLYKGLAIFQARTNTAAASIDTEAAMHLNGVYYFPSAKLSLYGGTQVCGNQWIADTIVIGGNQNLDIDYNGFDAKYGVFLVS